MEIYIEIPPPVILCGLRPWRRHHLCLGQDKRVARRTWRRNLNMIMKRMTHDPETYYDEGFNVHTLTSWDVD